LTDHKRSRYWGLPGIVSTKWLRGLQNGPRDESFDAYNTIRRDLEKKKFGRNVAQATIFC